MFQFLIWAKTQIKNGQRHKSKKETFSMEVSVQIPSNMLDGGDKYWRQCFQGLHTRNTWRVNS